MVAVHPKAYINGNDVNFLHVAEFDIDAIDNSTINATAGSAALAASLAPKGVL